MSVFQKWYWRGAAAIGVGSLALVVAIQVVGISSPINVVLSFLMRPNASWISEQIGIMLFYGVPTSFAAALTYGVLTEAYTNPDFEAYGETRCRECGYILRGISEPRCPECGEQI